MSRYMDMTEILNDKNILLFIWNVNQYNIVILLSFDYITVMLTVIARVSSVDFLSYLRMTM